MMMIIILKFCVSKQLSRVKTSTLVLVLRSRSCECTTSLILCSFIALGLILIIEGRFFSYRCTVIYSLSSSASGIQILIDEC